MTETLEQSDIPTTEEGENKPLPPQQKLIQDILDLLNKAEPGEAVTALFAIFPKSIESLCSIYQNPQHIEILDQYLKNCFFNCSLNIHKRFMILLGNLQRLQNSKKEALDKLAKESTQEAIQPEPQAESEVI